MTVERRCDGSVHVRLWGEDLREFASRWPCGGVRGSYVTFDARGDVTDTDLASRDGEAASVLIGTVRDAMARNGTPGQCCKAGAA